MRPLHLAFGLPILATLAACSAANSDGGATLSAALTTDGGSDAAAVSALTFREIGPILAETCGGCHNSDFNELADVKADRKLMISVIEGREMPADDDRWLDTPNGQAVVAYLKTSPELR
jgi:hypothetical protein